MAWTEEQLERLRIGLGAHQIRTAVVHHVTLLAAGQCTPEECIQRLLTDEVDAMRLLIGNRHAGQMREEIQFWLEMGGDDA